MTIQIDDALWGSLVGPTFIGAYRPETDEFAYGAVDVRFFQGRPFARKRYLQETTNVIRRLLESLRADDAETLEICTGGIFDHAGRNLGYEVRRTKITGRLQDLVEGVATDYLLSLGIPIDGVAPGAKHFRICLSWVAEDLSHREQFVKTGWKSWRSKWRWVAKRQVGRRRSR